MRFFILILLAALLQSCVPHENKSNVDEELLEQYTGTISIPFTLGEKRTIAVKIVDDRGVEMLIVKKI